MGPLFTRAGGRIIVHVITLNDNNRLGSGTRTYLVLREGRKLVKLLSLGSLQKVTVTKARYGQAKPAHAEPQKLSALLGRLVGYYRERLTDEQVNEFQGLRRGFEQHGGPTFTAVSTGQNLTLF